MKKVIAITIVLTLILAVVSSGTDSPKGGHVGKGEGFKIDVPTFDKKIKQGETQTITIKLQRGESFKQDVKLEVKLSKGEGITFDPAKVLVKASDKPDVEIQVSAAKNAALGEYIVSVTGTPTTGEPTSVEFNVKVVAPDAGYTMQSESPQGGSTLKGEGFKIAVPTFDTKVKQGEVQSVTISLKRGESFKQDVTLEIKLSKGEGITFDPAKVLVKASDKPDVQVRITVPKNADLGEYKASVTGIPTTGESTSVEFKVKVIAPKAGHTMQSESPQGGSTLKGEGFKIAVPAFDTKVKQGEVQSVIISLKRGESFKQDVKLEIKLSKGEGITFDPAKVLVKASDESDVQLRITVAKDAALGEYKVSVTGTPTTGESTSVEFKVKVIAPESGYTMQSDSPKGGSTLKGEGFKIAVPTFDTKIKQGETQNVTISLERGESFKQDVALEIKLFKGKDITFDPAKVLVKAGDKPDVQIRITASNDTALGEYKVYVTGTPTTGEPTSTEFNVNVVAP